MNENISPSSPQPPPKKKGRAILLLVLVFVLGVLAGTGGTTLIMLKRLQNHLRSPVLADGAGSRFIDRVDRNLSRELKLNPEEQRALGEELDVTKTRLRDLRAGLIRDVRSLAADTVDRIAKRLPEDKQVQLRERARERLQPWGVEPSRNP